MSGASDLGVKIESGDGYVKELVVTVASIFSMDVCMTLARAFSSANALSKRKRSLQSPKHNRLYTRDIPFGRVLTLSCDVVRH